MKKSYEAPLIEVIKLEEEIFLKVSSNQTGSEGGMNFSDLFNQK